MRFRPAPHITISGCHADIGGRILVVGSASGPEHPAGVGSDVACAASLLQNNGSATSRGLNWPFVGQESDSTVCGADGDGVPASKILNGRENVAYTQPRI